MKLRLKALLLALGLSAFAFSAVAYADETEQLADSAYEEEAVSEEEAVTEGASEAAAVTVADDDSESITEEEYYREMLESYLSQVSAWSDAQVEAYAESDDPATALIAYNWSVVSSELGNFEEVTEITDMEVTDSGYGGIITGLASYDGTGKGQTVYVSLEYEYTYSSTYGQYIMSPTGISWDIEETMGRMMRNAALNTLMGVCIVFVFLMVLSFLIGRIHYIPQLIENRNKSKEEQKESEPAETGTAPTVVTEAAGETPPDDLELIAVITAAVEAARSEEPAYSTGDSYVVRSIKKSDNRNWHRA